MEQVTQKEETSVELYFNRNVGSGKNPKRYRKVRTDDDPIAIDIEKAVAGYNTHQDNKDTHHMIVSMKRFLIGYSLLLVSCVTQSDPEPTYRLFEIDLGGVIPNKIRVSDKFTVYDALALDTLGDNILSDESIDYILRRYNYAASERIRFYDIRASILNNVSDVYKWKKEARTSEQGY